MKIFFANRSVPAGNPIANLFVIIVGLLVISASLVLGFFAFIIIGSIILVMAAIIGLRVWWFKRKLAAGMTAADRRPADPGDEVIEGEYRVVDDENKDA